MATAYNYLVIVFCTTAGQRGALLGTDETDLILLVWVVVDLETNKVVSFQQSFIRPDESEVSDDLCKALGVQRDVIMESASLDVVLQQFDHYLRTELNTSEGATFCLCTDGQLHVRQCIHPQALKKNVELQDYFCNFFDIRKEFRKCHPEAPQITTVKDMADYLKIECGKYNFTETGHDECATIAQIVQRLVAEGHIFSDPEDISRKYEPGTYEKTDRVPDETVVKARGLPWQASDRDVFRFFKGLNIAKGGVALCLNLHGRRNGEVMVRFVNQQHRDMALQRHRHNLGKRYVEVFKGTSEDFIRVAAGTSREAALFLSRDDGHIIVRMRGLPFTSSAKDVVEFFGPEVPVAGLEDGILFVKHRNGKMTGDAFVLFATEEIATRALAKHKEYLGTRYIEIFRSTTAEVQQVLSRLHQEPLLPEGPHHPQIQSIPHHHHPAMIPQPHPHPHLIHGIPHPFPAHIPGHMPVPAAAVPAGLVRDCIRMRGLPFTATIEDIMAFLGEFADFIRPQGVHMVYNLQGKPNGEAFIQMLTAEKAFHTAGKCHMKYMGTRFIEVFQCSAEEMSYMLTGGVVNPKPPTVTPPVSSVISPTTPQIPYPQHSHAGTIIPTSYQQPRPHPGATTTMMPHPATHPMYFFPSPPVSPTGQLYYPTAAATNSAIIRLRGLQYGATQQDVANFFQGYGVPAENVQMQCNGDALVPFYSQDLAVKALQEKQMVFPGKMELFMA
ncbi:epithelial splicing regulatory protein 1-like [Amphiura filiformis]|uniref:epithelial splicing regulatory protein 1-like n=1 Tax=Amphiura filiformis TaxID=82378 RepID=UPI003B219543